MTHAKEKKAIFLVTVFKVKSLVQFILPAKRNVKWLTFTLGFSSKHVPKLTNFTPYLPLLGLQKNNFAINLGLDNIIKEISSDF